MPKVTHPTSSLPADRFREGLLPGMYTNEDGSIDIQCNDLAAIREIVGTETEAAAGAIFDNLCVSCVGPERLNGAKILAFLQELQPENGLEAMLVAQMTTTHFALAYAAGKFYHARSSQESESYERSMTRLNRTFTLQIETLLRTRGEGQSASVSVGNVNVGEGGKAIVGNVQTNGK